MQREAGCPPHAPQGVEGKPRRAFVTTTDSKHSQKVASNILNQRYGVKQVEALNRVWAGAITLVATAKG
ncbi:hypothetical protein IAD21_00026 [Abditibacteriota bacterium]|nr:hypothetical protein IAD21_00026 [Abditibacteriota bacterium]